MANELQVKYAGIADAVERANLVTVDTGMVPVFNTNFEGDPASGSVKIPYRADVVAGDYNKATGIAAAASSTAYATLTIDKDKATNEILDGYDVDAVPDDMIANRLGSAGFAMAETLDTDGLATLAAQGTVLENTTALTADTVQPLFIASKVAQSKAKVPSEGRYALVSPDVMGYILTKKLADNSDIAEEIKAQGYVGRLAGYYIKETTALPEGVEVIFGHALWATRVTAWKVDPKVVSLDGDASFVGASAVKARKCYGHKVTKPASILVKTVE